MVPFDKQAILDSVEKTGRLVCVDPAHKVCSAASEIASIVAQEAFWSLQAPIMKVASEQVHIPYTPALERFVYPNKDKVVEEKYDPRDPRGLTGRGLTQHEGGVQPPSCRSGHVGSFHVQAPGRYLAKRPEERGQVGRCGHTPRDRLSGSLQAFHGARSHRSNRIACAPVLNGRASTGKPDAR